MLITIIIPVYNKVKYIEGILHQLQTQSFTDFECLLIDDGSTDGSGEICDRFAAKDTRFRTFHIPNGGVSHARNIGLDEALGDYITFIDSDDLIHPDYLNNLVICAKESKADLVISGYDKTAEDGSTICTVTPANSGLFKFQDILSGFTSEQLKTGLYGCCTAKVFPKRLVKDIRFNEDLRLAEDLDFYLKLYKTISTVYFDDHTWYYYLQNTENSTGNIADNKIDYIAQLNIWLHCKKMLKVRNAYSDQNMEDVDKRIYDYIYFSLFHCNMDNYQSTFTYLYNVWQAEKLNSKAASGLQRWFFMWLNKGVSFVPKCTIKAYRKVRIMIKKD